MECRGENTQHYTLEYVPWLLYQWAELAGIVSSLHVLFSPFHTCGGPICFSESDADREPI